MTQENLLKVEGLCAKAGDKEVLRGVSFEIAPSEVHAVMGPNGSGKSTLAHVMMGRPGYEVTAGEITLNGKDILSLTTWERAQAGLFLAMQQPTEIPGVKISELVEASAIASGQDVQASISLLLDEAKKLGIEESFLNRDINVDLSGGEKKRNETLQLVLAGAQYAVLDEIDSGLDIDALGVVSERIKEATTENQLGVLAITHFSRLLDVLKPDVVHVLVDGQIAGTGDAALVSRLEKDGYQDFLT